MKCTTTLQHYRGIRVNRASRDPDLVARRERIAARQREIGEIIREHRKLQGMTLEQCGEFLGMRRQSFSAIENGETAIGAAELELLMEYLNITRDEMWPQKQTEGRVRRVELPILPGETLQITVDMAERL